MRKLITCTLFLLFPAVIAIAQPPTYYTSYNMTSTAFTYAPVNHVNKSLEVGFKIQNDSVTLVDSFITSQPLLDSFLYTNIQSDTILVDYDLGNGGACNPDMNGGYYDNDSIHVYSMRLFHKDSFNHKVIRYKNIFYNHTDIGTPNWRYSPKEYDIDDTRKGTYYLGSSIFYMQPTLCPTKIHIISDSIFLQVARVEADGTPHQLLRENVYSTPDSFNLRLHSPCENSIALASYSSCHRIYVGDTLTTDSLDINLSSLGTNYWFHYRKTNSGISTNIIAPLPAIGLKVSIRSMADYNRLDWTTISEKNTHYYYIMKSYDAIDYFEIGKQRAAGNSDLHSNYSYEDLTKSNSQTVYYRIDLEDIDGNRTSSNVVRSVFDGRQDLFVSPNPVYAISTLHGLNNQDYEIDIFTIDGTHKLNKTLLNVESEPLNLSNYPNGIYILRIRNMETGTIVSKKIIKE